MSLQDSFEKETGKDKYFGNGVFSNEYVAWLEAEVGKLKEDNRILKTFIIKEGLKDKYNAQRKLKTV